MNLNKIYFIPTDNFPSDINWPPENLPLIICTCRCLKKLYGVRGHPLRTSAPVGGGVSQKRTRSGGQRQVRTSAKCVVFELNFKFVYLNCLTTI